MTQMHKLVKLLATKPHEAVSEDREPRVRFGRKILGPVSIGHAVFVALLVLSGETGEAWTSVAAIAIAQLACSLPLGAALAHRRFYFAANVTLATINYSAGAAMIIVCGGYPSPIWTTSLFGIYPSAFFLGPEGALLNAGISLAAQLIPHLDNLEAGVLIGAGAYACTVAVLGLIAVPMIKIVVGAEAEQRKNALALEEANENLTEALAVAKRDSDERVILNEMSDMIQASIDSDEAFSIVAGYSRQLFPEHAGALFLYRNSRDSLELATSWGEISREGLGAFKSQECWALRKGLPHESVRANPEVCCQHVGADPDFEWGFCVPLMAQGDLLGVFHLRAREADDEASGPPLDRTLAITVARDGALGLANLRLRETLRNQALRDPLTQLYNRRYLEDTLPREIHRAERTGRPLAVAMLDIDHFKQFNDTHGHAAGDLVLREVGGFLTSYTRHGDLACRYGGEEFVVMFADTPLEAAIERADQLRAGLCALAVRHEGNALGRITASVGVAGMPQVPGDDLLRVADTLLYRAKAEGRDRVVAPV